MESIQEYLKRLAFQSNLIDEHDAQDYVLTPEDEERAISHAIEQKKKHMAFKLANAGFSEMEILSRISQVNWDMEIDKKEILTIANSNKSHFIWENDQRYKERERQVQLQEKAKAERRLLKEMFCWENLRIWARDVSLKEYGKNLISNENSFKLLYTICLFLSEDKKFETELGFSLKKGLLLRGISGIGKTYLPTCLKDNPLNPIKIVNILEITDYVKEDGEYEVRTNGKIFCIDDIGTEPTPIKHYGTDINWFKNFIELYYAKKQPFNRVIISTNLNFELLTEKYGYRVTSRMKEMFNTINVEGTDLRNYHA